MKLRSDWKSNPSDRKDHLSPCLMHNLSSFQTVSTKQNKAHKSTETLFFWNFQMRQACRKIILLCLPFDRLQEMARTLQREGETFSKSSLLTNLKMLTTNYLRCKQSWSKVSSLPSCLRSPQGWGSLWGWGLKTLRSLWLYPTSSRKRHAGSSLQLPHFWFYSQLIFCVWWTEVVTEMYLSRNSICPHFLF